MKTYFAYGTITLCGRAFPDAFCYRSFQFFYSPPTKWCVILLQPFPPTLVTVRMKSLGSSLFARRYWGNGFWLFYLANPCGINKIKYQKLVFCSSGYWEVSLRRVRSTLLLHNGSSGITQMGFPHSDTFGSKLASQLPEAFRRHATSFFAVFVSRHPPYALNSNHGNKIENTINDFL